MNNPLKSETSAALGLLLARVPLGVFFVIAGCNKLVHTGFRQFASANVGNVPAWASRDAARYYLLSLPFVEIVVGLLLVLGLFTRIAGLLSALIIASVIAALHTFTRDSVPHPNLLFLGIALMTLFTGPGRMSLDKAFFGKGGGAPG